jgi:hypothetical protein
VSVSAVNYSQLTDAQLFDAVKNPGKDNADIPQALKSAKPLYYLALPGEVYPSDVAPDAVYRELEIALEKHNYFNVVYQERAGHKPRQIDYLLRVHYGVRPLLIPSVRADRITWGDDGIVANKYMVNLTTNPGYDPRTGLSQDEQSRLHLASLYIRNAGTAGTTTGGGEPGMQPDPVDQHGAIDAMNEDTQTSHLFSLVVVEAFKFADVKALDKKAPCIWAAFIGVPVEGNEKFSSVLHAMMQSAAPYLGGTTDGIQQGSVLVGTPVVVPSAR